MDPERVRAYLQVACAGLGFDVGEVWWSSNESGSSTLASIEQDIDSDSDASFEDASKAAAKNGNRKKRIRFVQLYTSKSYGDRRSKLVTPPTETKSDGGVSELEKHVLSPRLVDAISNTAKVVWANCEKREGLLGRSDMRLQTAVGMPVAMDGDGNMCIVVMFSPNNVKSSDEAMEYLNFISKSAASSSIPGLLPAIDPTRNRGLVGDPGKSLMLVPGQMSSPLLTSIQNLSQEENPDTFGEGVTARFVSFRDNDEDPSDVQMDNSQEEVDYNAAHHPNHSFMDTPKDLYGIPILPSFAELGNNTEDKSNDRSSSPFSECTAEAFDDATYGVWSTIMNNSTDDPNGVSEKSTDSFLNKGGESSGLQGNFATALQGSLTTPDSRMSSSSTISQLLKPILPPVRQERLEEFISAFLGMSVFDVADVWMPTSGDDAHLSHVMSVTASDQNETLNEFKKATTGSTLKIWSGAVGKAYASGNAVWTNKQDAFVDAGRSAAFAMAKIRTALAVPIFTDGVFTPACVLCCYSLVRTDAVPFVLRFVQQALRLVWMGLDQVEPHESVGKDLWKDVAPADLGEMAADTEMQQAFMVGKQKRTHDDISSSTRSHSEIEEAREIGNSSSKRDRSSSLALQLQTLNTGSTSTPLSAYSPGTDVRVMAPEATAAAPVTVPAELVESHVQRAIQSLRDAIPWSMYQHIATNPDGSKRAHTLSNPSPNVTSQSPHIMQHRGLEPVLLQPLPQPQSMPSRAPNSMAQPSFGREPALQQGYNFQPGQPTLSHANHSGVEQQFFPLHISSVNPTSVEVAPPKEDPAVARANIETFNAMARMQNTGNAMNAPHPIQSTSINAPFWLEQSFEAGSTGFQSRSNVPNFSHGNFQLNGGNNHVPENVFSSSNGFALPIQGLTHHNSAPSKPTGKTCRIHGCDSPTISRRPYCLQHSGNRLCEHDGCSKCAQGSTRFCIAHGGGRRCTFPGCDKGARDKFFCAAHGGGKRCSHDGCTKSAVGGSSLCTSHGGGRRCAIDGCEKSAQSSTKFCVKHGGGKKCSNPECDKVARGKTLFCAAHGGGVRCKLEGCNRVAIGKLQLCRAHGGGTKSRSESKSGSPKLPPINA